MFSAEGRAQLLLAILAVFTLAASGQAAAQPGGELGPVSHASLQIRVFVAERVGVRKSSVDGALPQGPCIVSTAKARTFAATLEPIRRHEDRPAYSFEIAAASAGQACNGDDSLQRALAAIVKDGSPVPHLLILAPQ